METSADRSFTHCAICTEELKKPKFLPCHHTMCLKCVEHLHSGRGPVPCPFCRSLFSAPAASLPTNTYAEELVRFSREAGRQLEIVRGELKVVKTQLEEADGARQIAVDQRRSLDVARAETTAKLKELERNSSQSEKQLESRLRELETRESCLQEQLQKACERYKDAECKREKASIEAKACQAAKKDAETSLSKEKQSCQSLRLLLQQTQQESRDKLQDAAKRLSAARTEAETCLKAKNGVEESLEWRKQLCRTLQQQLQLMQRELDQSKQEVIGLNEQMTMERSKMSEQIDYKKAHAEGSQLIN